MSIVDKTVVRAWLVAALVFVLPLHTVFVSAWVAWKPFLILLIALAAWDVVDGIRVRRWPWHVPTSLAVAIFLGIFFWMIRYRNQESNEEELETAPADVVAFPAAR